MPLSVVATAMGLVIHCNELQIMFIRVKYKCLHTATIDLSAADKFSPYDKEI